MDTGKMLVLVPLIIVGTLCGYRAVIFGLSYQKWMAYQSGSGITDALPDVTDSMPNGDGKSKKVFGLFGMLDAIGASIIGTAAGTAARGIAQDAMGIAEKFERQAQYNAILIGLEFALFIMLLGLFVGRLQIDKILTGIGCALSIVLFIGLIILKMQGGTFLIP